MIDVDARARELDEKIHNEIVSVSTHSRKLMRSMFRIALRECVEQETKELQCKLTEAEAQAAVRDNAFRELLQYLHTINDDRAVGFSAPMPVEVLEKAQVVLASLLSAV